MLKPGKAVVVRSDACNKGKFVTVMHCMGEIEFRTLGGPKVENGWYVTPSLQTWDGSPTHVLGESQLENVDDFPTESVHKQMEYCHE